MPNVSIKYVFWGRAGKRRHGGTTTIPVPDEMLNTGKATVLFWSVVGAAGGPIVSFTQAIPSFGVGSDDIFATAFCVSGNGIPRDEAYIDAFDIDTGTFLDDDFVSVHDAKNGPKNQAMSQQANDYGSVPTSTNEFVFADLPLPEGGFQYWKVFSNTLSPNGIELETTPAWNGSISFAFYQKPKKPSITPINIGALMPIILGSIPGGIIILGPHGPVIIHYGGPDPGPEFTHILAAAQQYALSAQLSPSLRREGFELAAKQLASASKAVLKSAQVRPTKAKE